jgi:hypothetical protein
LTTKIENGWLADEILHAVLDGEPVPLVLNE